VKWLKNKLIIQETADLSLDDPSLTAKRREIIQNKGFLRRIYVEWYDFLAGSVPSGQGEVLEIGSGGGFMGEFIPELITSDVFPCPGVDIVMDACGAWPFDDRRLKAVLMVDVLHHLPNVRNFFRQADAAVGYKGIVAMVEPWVTPWSHFIYSRVHHEPFMPQTQEWTFPARGPLSGANSALPWIIFHRDRHLFEKNFPNWNIDKIQPFMPLSYILSGGVSLRSLMPENVYFLIRQLEKRSGLEQYAAMFASIILRKNG
jgi:hypothetical protein